MIIIASPILWAIIITFSLRGFRLTASMPRNSICPPSRIGIGKRLSTPRFMLITAMNRKKFMTPSDACCPAIWNIIIGPPNVSAGIILCMSLTIPTNVRTTISHVLLIPNDTALRGLYFFITLLPAGPMPISPICFSVPSGYLKVFFSGVTVNSRKFSSRFILSLSGFSGLPCIIAVISCHI